MTIKINNEFNENFKKLSDEIHELHEKMNQINLDPDCDVQEGIRISKLIHKKQKELLDLIEQNKKESYEEKN